MYSVRNIHRYTLDLLNQVQGSIFTMDMKIKRKDCKTFYMHHYNLLPQLLALEAVLYEQRKWRRMCFNIYVYKIEFYYTFITNATIPH